MNEIVRQPVRARPSSRRRIMERLALGFPGLSARLTRVFLRLSPRSALRRALTRYFVRLLFEAANRGDFEAAFALITSDEFETTTPPDLVGLGFEPTYRGRDGRLRFQHQWMTELGEFHQEPQEVIDLGDRLLMIGHMHGVGANRGAAFDSEVAYLITYADGRIAGEESFRSHQEAFEAAGIASDSGP